MRIAVVNNYVYLRGGAERVMLDELRQLRASGHDVTLFGRSNDRHTGLPHEELFPLVADYPRTSGFQRVRAAADVVYNSANGRLFAEFCERTQPDLVHFHNIYAGLTTAVLDVCRKRRLPSVITLHDYKLICPSYLMLNRGLPCTLCAGGKFRHCLLTRCHKGSAQASFVSTVESYFNRWSGKYLQATFLICPSRFLLERMAESGLPRDQLRWIPNGVDVERTLPSYDDRGYFLYFGRLSREKGIRTLLEAAAGMAMPLLIVGDGPERPALEEWTRSRRMGHVAFAGHKTGNELERIISGAAFVVVPSEWYENASLSVLEAMAHGKAVVASRIGGIPEQIVDGRTGLLFEPGNSDDLRRAIAALIHDPDSRRVMEKEARLSVEQRYSLDTHCERLKSLYREAIECGGFARVSAPLPRTAAS